MLESLQGIINQSKFRIQEIMTPWDMVQTEPLSKDAFQNASYWLGIYDYIPLTKEGSVATVLDLRSGNAVPVRRITVKASAHLLDSFRIASNYANGKPTVLLVGTGRKPRGIITHADLNKTPVRLMLYMIFLAFEINISSLISRSFHDALSSLVKWRNRLVHPTHPPRVLLSEVELTSLWKALRTLDEVMPRFGAGGRQE